MNSVCVLCVCVVCVCCMCVCVRVRVRACVHVFDSHFINIRGAELFHNLLGHSWSSQTPQNIYHEKEELNN